MSQTTEAVRAAIVATLKTVPGMGAVHDRERYASQQTALQALYVVQTDEGKQLHGWFVRRLGFSAKQWAPRQRLVRTRWQLRGFMALKDETASEIAFDAVIDGVRRAIDVDPTLGGAVFGTSLDDEIGAQLAASGPVMFAGVLCHAADMTLITETLESPDD